jgi:hypothetical protein
VLYNIYTEAHIAIASTTQQPNNNMAKQKRIVHLGVYVEEDEPEDRSYLNHPWPKIHVPKRDEVAPRGILRDWEDTMLMIFGTRWKIMPWALHAVRTRF